MTKTKQVIASFLDMVKKNEVNAEDVSVLIKGLVSFNPDLAQEAIEVSDSQLNVTHNLLEEAEKEHSLSKVDTCVDLLSRRYSVLLAQIGTVEAQLELCENIRCKAEQAGSRVYIGTLPAILMLNFVSYLKDSIWATITWEEEPDTLIKEIIDYARLISIYVEPNKAWDGQIRFVFRMKSYITEVDFMRVCKRLGKKYDYYHK